jgi:SpoVK/Ycf46/Vps4 family AAA+-type ATPase
MNIKNAVKGGTPFRMIEKEMRSGDHVLIKEYQLIEPENNGGMRNPQYFILSDKAKNEFLEECATEQKTTKCKKDFIIAASIAQKKLFYNEEQNRQIEELTNLLQEENFKNIQNRLEESGMRKGFACLFYGFAGTGKTETVYQISRLTKRDIFTLNITEVQSKWVGENEKLIKQVFDRYRGVVKAGGLAPILLFNEADAIIAKRLNISDDSRSVDQMENRVQNIILQEIENLDGILIATTNLTGNMDRAFERRFLYKIEFAKPDISIRQAIWKSIIPELSDMETKTLASKYDFSGGQIENIARKRAVDDIISAESANIDNLLSFCQEEILERGAGKKIGFVMSR